MRKTFSSTHVDAGEALRNFAELTKHDDGARTFMLTALSTPSIVNLYAESPTQLRDLALAMLAAADKWSAEG